MDCNRDEAARSRDIAAKKFVQKDFAGAKKFALKARQLFPDLEGLVQFIAVVEVHATANEKLQCGEMDWYGILQSDPSTDEASLRKQYRKLALILHPDKNKSLGAEAAFKYISEAWTILSDNTKKANYDSKRNPPASRPVPVKKPGPAPQNKQKGKPPPRWKQAQKPPSSGCQPQPSPHASSLGTTFWTACPDCRLQYEYHVFYKHKNLCCPFCLKPFLAKELAVVINGPIIWPPLQEQNRVNANNKSGHCSVNGYACNTKFNTAPGNGHLEKSQVKPDERKENIDVHQEKSQVNSDERKENVDVHTPSVMKEQLRKKETDQLNCNLREETEAPGPPRTRLNVEMEHKLTPDKSSKEGCKVSATARTMEYSGTSTAVGCRSPGEEEGGRMDIPSVGCEVQLDSSPSKKARVNSSSSLREQMLKGMSKTEPSEACRKDKNDDHNTEGSLDQEISVAGNHNPNTHDTEMDCLVPDSDFYIFDSDRTEQHFASGQIWACYDDDDGFPRYYARVVKVTSQQPFKIQYTWLEARSSSEEVMSWLDSGFSYTCGEFKLGKTLSGDSVCMFSHLMPFDKGQKGSFKIFPRKGEIWALYKDWASLITKDDKHGYDLVEVLTDYSDESGVQVCLLVKVEGYKSVFMQLSEVVIGVLPDQMRRFSHNIPVRRLVAGEVPQCIEGYLELDPASTPMK